MKGIQQVGPIDAKPNQEQIEKENI